MDIEPKLLRAFLAIYEAASVTAAADRSGVTQPTMSAHLRRLRVRFDDPLFCYGGRRLEPTAKARELHPHIVAVIEGLDRLGEAGAAWSPTTSDRQFTISASGYVQQRLLPALDRRLKSSGPDLRLQVHGSRLASGLPVDAIVAPREALEPMLKSRALFDERLICLIDEGQLGPSEQLTIARFCELDHVLVAPAPSPPHDAVDRALKELERSRRVMCVVESDADLAPLLIGQARLAMLPERAARRYAAPLCVMTAPVTLQPITFAIAWPATLDRDVGSRWFRDQVVAAAKEVGLVGSQPS